MLKALKEGELTPEQAAQYWGESYQDMRIDPKAIKSAKIVVEHIPAGAEDIAGGQITKLPSKAKYSSEKKVSATRARDWEIKSEDKEQIEAKVKSTVTKITVKQMPHEPEGIYGIYLKDQRVPVGTIRTEVQGKSLIADELVVDRKGLVNKGFLKSVKAELTKRASEKGLDILEVVHRPREDVIYRRSGFKEMPGTKIVKAGQPVGGHQVITMGAKVPKGSGKKKEGATKSPKDITSNLPAGSTIKQTYQVKLAEGVIETRFSLMRGDEKLGKVYITESPTSIKVNYVEVESPYIKQGIGTVLLKEIPWKRAQETGKTLRGSRKIMTGQGRAVFEALKAKGIIEEVETKGDEFAYRPIKRGETKAELPVQPEIRKVMTGEEPKPTKESIKEAIKERKHIPLKVLREHRDVVKEERAERKRAKADKEREHEYRERAEKADREEAKYWEETKLTAEQQSREEEAELLKKEAEEYWEKAEKAEAKGEKEVVTT